MNTHTKSLKTFFVIQSGKIVTIAFKKLPNATQYLSDVLYREMFLPI